MEKDDLRLVALWAVLLALTFTSLEAIAGTGLGSMREWGVGVVLVLAFVKVRIVVMHFMEVGHAPWPFRLALECWIVGVCATLLVINVGALAPA